jgi:hypothetical protein
MTTVIAEPTIDELNATYRQLKAERTSLLTAAKRANNGKWPDGLKADAKTAGLSVTDYVAKSMSADDLSSESTARLAEIDAELQSLSDARRLIQKPSRQKAAAERKVNVAAKVAAMTAEEKAAFKAALGE